MQLLHWMISSTTGISWERGGATRPRPGITGFMGSVLVISPRLGSESGVENGREYTASKTAGGGKAVTQYTCIKKFSSIS